MDLTAARRRPALLGWGAGVLALLAALALLALPPLLERRQAQAERDAADRVCLEIAQTGDAVLDCLDPPG